MSVDNMDFECFFFIIIKSIFLNAESSFGSDNINLIYSFSYKKEVFYNVGGKILEQVVQGGGGSPIPVNIPDQVG